MSDTQPTVLSKKGPLVFYVKFLVFVWRMYFPEHLNTLFVRVHCDNTTFFRYLKYKQYKVYESFV